MNQDVSATSTQGGFTDSADIAITKTASHSATSTQGGVADSADIAITKAASRTDAHRLYITPFPRTHTIYVPPPGWIYWMTWNTITMGHCSMDGARLHLYPDGMILFQATTSTSSSGDVWLIKGIQFLDQSRNPIGHPVPQHNGMNMAWEGSEYPLIFWDAIPGVTPSGASAIRHATMTYHC